MENPTAEAPTTTNAPRYDWRSDEINLLVEALVKAQAEIEDAPRSGNNQFKGYCYATIADIRQATKEPLARHGLAITQLPFTTSDGQSIRLRSILLHTSGQWIASVLQARCEGVDKEKAGVMDMQKVGSAITYMRKYALQAMTGVAADDDDGQATTQQGHRDHDQGRDQRRDYRDQRRDYRDDNRGSSRRQQRQPDRHTNRQASRPEPRPETQGQPQPRAQEPPADQPIPAFRDWLAEWVKFGNEWWTDCFDKKKQAPPSGYPSLINQYQLSRHLFKWGMAESVLKPAQALPERPSNAQIERTLSDAFPGAVAKFDAEAEHYIKKTRPAQVKHEIEQREAKAEAKQAG